jgi:hypothetical protein
MEGYDALVFNTRREKLPDFADLTLAKAEQDGMKRSSALAMPLFVSTLPRACPRPGRNIMRSPVEGG